MQYMTKITKYIKLMQSAEHSVQDVYYLVCDFTQLEQRLGFWKSNVEFLKTNKKKNEHIRRRI